MPRPSPQRRNPWRTPCPAASPHPRGRAPPCRREGFAPWRSPLGWRLGEREASGKGEDQTCRDFAWKRPRLPALYALPGEGNEMPAIALLLLVLLVLMFLFSGIK